MNTNITLSLTATQTGLPGLSSGQLTATRTNTGADVGNLTQNIGTSDEALAIPADIGTEGEVAIKSLDATNYIELSYDTGGSFDAYKFAKVRPGGLLLFTPAYPTGKTSIYARANTSAVYIQLFAVEE